MSEEAIKTTNESIIAINDEITRLKAEFKASQTKDQADRIDTLLVREEAKLTKKEDYLKELHKEKEENKIKSAALQHATANTSLSGLDLKRTIQDLREEMVESFKKIKNSDTSSIMPVEYTEFWNNHIRSNNPDNSFVDSVNALETMIRNYPSYSKFAIEFNKYVQNNDPNITEDREQHDAMKLAITHFPESLAYKWEWCARKEYLNKKKPDFVIHEYKTPIENPLGCIFVVELVHGPIDSKHKGKTARYAMDILKLQAPRKFVICAVSNLINIVFIRVEKIGSSEYRIRYTTELSLSIYWMYVIDLMNHFNKVGYVSYNIEYEKEWYNPSRFLGHGATANVYTVANKDKCVVKIFSKSEFYVKEKAIMQELTKSSDSILKLIGFNDQCQALILSPYGNKLTYPYKLETILKMFQCLIKLAKLKIIHRDLSTRHFLEEPDMNTTASSIATASLSTSAPRSDLRVFIIDFGCSFIIKNTDQQNLNFPTSYKGTLRFAAQEILDHFVRNKDSYVPKIAHDLESFLKVIMFAQYETIRKLFDNNNQNQFKMSKAEKANLISHLWGRIFSTCKEKQIESFGDLLLIARRGNIQEFEKKLISLKLTDFPILVFDR